MGRGLAPSALPDPERSAPHVYFRHSEPDGGHDRHPEAFFPDASFCPAPGLGHQPWLHEPVYAVARAGENRGLDRPGLPADDPDHDYLLRARPAVRPPPPAAVHGGPGVLCHQLCLLLLRDLPGRHSVHPRRPAGGGAGAGHDQEPDFFPGDPAPSDQTHCPPHGQ